jgi:hypothetical protein
MKTPGPLPSRFVLPLPRFVLHPVTSLGLGTIHMYLAAGHLGQLASRDVEWTHIWKGFGALAGAYIFAALASRGLPEPRAGESCNPETVEGSK